MFISLPPSSLFALSQKLADVSSNDSSDSLETRFLSILCTRSYPHLRRGRITFLHQLQNKCLDLGWMGGGEMGILSRLRLSPVSPAVVGRRQWEELVWPGI